jgi:hypothetical protein
MRLIALALALLLSGCASMPKSEVYSAGCAALDITTTAVALNDGATEANPFVIDGYEVASLVVTSTLAHWGIRHWAEKAYHNQGKAAPWWLGYGSYRCALATWNINQILEAQP